MRRYLSITVLVLIILSCSKGSDIRFDNQFDQYKSAITFHQSSKDPVDQWEVLPESWGDGEYYVQGEILLSNSDIQSIRIVEASWDNHRKSLRQRLMDLRYNDDVIPQEIMEGQHPLNTAPPFVMYIYFTEEGGERFFDITSELIGENLAIVVDGEVLMSAQVVEGIRGGSCQVSGSYSKEEWINIARAITGN